jgi:hypothetical protein
VLFSLAELQLIEHERVAAERAEQQEARARRDLEHRQAEQERERSERERILAERAAFDGRARDEAESQARVRAREQSALEVARIEAEAKVRLAAEERARSHELALLRMRTHSTLYRACVGLGIALGVVVSAAAAGTWHFTHELDRVTQDSLQSQRERDSIARERDRVAAESARARTTWQSRIRATEATLAACEIQNEGKTSTGHKGIALSKPPLDDNRPVQIPPATSCEFEGDPLCDVSDGSR